MQKKQTSNRTSDNMTQIKESVLSGALPIVAVKIGTAGFAFLLSVILNKILGANEYGQYVYLITWVTSLSILGVMGLNRLAVRYVPTLLPIKDNDTRITLYNFLFYFASITSFIVSFVFFALIRLGIVTSISEIPSSTSAVLIFILLLTIGTRILGGIVEGQKKVLLSKILVESCLPFFMALVVVAVWSLGLAKTINRDSLLFLYMLILLFAAFVLIAVLKANSRSSYRHIFKLPKLSHYNLFRDWTGITLAFTVIANINLIMNQADVLMLGAMDGAVSVAVYATVRKISTFQLFILIGFNSYLAPRISEMLKHKNYEKLQILVNSITLYSSLLTFLIGIIIYAFRFSILNLFGNEFLIGSLPLLFLLIAQFINVLTGPVGQLLNMGGHHRTALKCGIFSAGLNLALNYMWIPSYGLMGAAIASSISIVLNNLLMMYFANRNLPVKSGIFMLLYSNQNA
jgi:O-antigen/teichoic acid export membrane protein